MKFMLVSAIDLARNPGWRVFDCSHDSSDTTLGRSVYREAHIPGAIFADLEHDLSGPAGEQGGRHPLPDPRMFASWLGRQGVRSSDRIVAYDRGTGHAARLWWLLRWIGHDGAAVLDGGFAEWTRVGLPTTSIVPEYAPSCVVVNLRPDYVVDAASIHASLLGRRFLVIDGRREARYSGEEAAEGSIPGHIPGARNRHPAQNLDANGKFKSPGVLLGEFSALLGHYAPSAVVSQCGSGVLACHNLLAMEVAGLTGARLYPGSWSEWSTLPSYPVATGREPG